MGEDYGLFLCVKHTGKLHPAPLGNSMSPNPNFRTLELERVCAAFCFLGAPRSSDLKVATLPFKSESHRGVVEDRRSLLPDAKHRLGLTACGHLDLNRPIHHLHFDVFIPQDSIKVRDLPQIRNNRQQSRNDRRKRGMMRAERRAVWARNVERKNDWVPTPII